MGFFFLDLSKIKKRRDASLFCPTALRTQTQTKKNFESVAKQHFQNFSWFGFEREAL